jgi:hypothetical protein
MTPRFLARLEAWVELLGYIQGASSEYLAPSGEIKLMWAEITYTHMVLIFVVSGNDSLLMYLP